MKYLLTACILFAIACQQKSTDTQQVQSNISDTSKLFIPSYAVTNFEGTYTGSFDDGYMTLVLNYVTGKNASGFNIHKGNRRNINGTIDQAANGYKFTMKEPGDNPYDGTFVFTIDTVKFTMTGHWEPFDSSKTKGKNLALQKQKNKSISYDQQLGTWVPTSGNYSTDTTLDFFPEGSCEYRFYQFPGDSTSQLISVKGNYIEKSDTVFIEWQKNTYTPAQKMKLIKRRKKVVDSDYEEQQLIGNGWRMSKIEAG